MSQFSNPLFSSRNPLESETNPLDAEQRELAQQQEPSDVEVTDSKTPAPDDSGPLWDTTDVLMATPRGVVNAGKGIYNTVDWIAGDFLPDWKTNPLGESSSTAGALLSGLVEFGLPFVGAFKLINAAGKAGKLAKGLGWLARESKAEMAVTPTSSLLRRMGQDAVVGAGVSAILATPGQQRLANLATRFDSPLLNNDITRYLASGENESQLEARFKSALESLPVGLAVDAGLVAIGKIAKGMMAGIKVARGGQVEGNKALAAGGTEEQAVQVATDEELRLGVRHAAEIHEGKVAWDDLVGGASKDEQQRSLASRTKPDTSQVDETGSVVSNAHEYIPPKKGPVSFKDAEVVRKQAASALRSMGFESEKGLQQSSSLDADPHARFGLVTIEELVAQVERTKELVLKAFDEVVDNTLKWSGRSDPHGFASALSDELQHLRAADFQTHGRRTTIDQYSLHSLTKKLTGPLSGTEMGRRFISTELNLLKTQGRVLHDVATGVLAPDDPKFYHTISKHVGEAADSFFTSQGGRLRTQGFLNGGSVHETLQDALKNADSLGLSETQVAFTKWLLFTVPKQLKQGSLSFTQEVATKASGIYSSGDHSIKIFGQRRSVLGGDVYSTVLHESMHTLTVRKIDVAFAKIGINTTPSIDDLADDGLDLGSRTFGTKPKKTKIQKSRVFPPDSVVFAAIPKLAKSDPEIANLILLYKAYVDNTTKVAQAARDTGYGATDLYEFLSEGIMNNRFQEALRMVRSPNGSNLWTKFVAVVADLVRGKSSQMFEEFRASLYDELDNLNPLYEANALDGSGRLPPHDILKKGAQAASSDENSALDAFLTESAKLIEQPATTVKATDVLRSQGRVHHSPATSGDGSVDPSFRARNDAPRQQPPIPNVAETDVISLSKEVVDVLNRSLQSGGMDKAGVDLLMSHVQQATGENLTNAQFAFDHGTRSPEFLLAMTDAILQNKDYVATARRTETNAETAAKTSSFLDLMHAVGGMNAEQEARMAATLTHYTAPQFEQLQAVVSAMAGNKINLLLDVLHTGDQAAQDQIMISVRLLSTAREAGNSIAGRVLQNAKMFANESLAYKVKSMSPQEVGQKLAKLKELVDIGVIDKETFFKIKNGGFVNAGGTGQMTWLFKNSILSGPATSAVNSLSGVLSMLYMPMERAMGHAALSLIGQSSMTAARRELAVYRGYLTAFTQVWNDAATAPCWQNIKASWEQEGNAVTLGSQSSPMGEFVPRRPIAAANPAINKVTSRVGLPTTRWDPATKTNQRTVFGTALDWFGKLAGTPTRVMGTIDETLSIVTAQAEAREIIIESAPDAMKGDPTRLAAYVASKMKEVFDDVGALFSEDAVRARIMREAKSAGYEPGSSEWRAYVQNQMAKQWTAPQGLDRENNILLQRIAEKVRRRVEESTFKRDYDTIVEGNTIGPSIIGNLGKAASGLVHQVPILAMIIPFVKTPTNLAVWALERAPSSAGRRLYKEWQNPELRGEVMGRLCAGTLMYGTMLTLAMGGKITGRGPNDPNVRKALLDSGWLPNAFKIGETYVQYARLDPFATIFGMTADLVEIASHKYTDKEFLNASDAFAKVAIGTVANNLVNKTYLAGLKGTLDAITSWETKGDAFLKQYAGSFVPNIVAQSNLVMNDDLAAPKSMLDAVRARVPGLSHLVDRRRNALGEPMENNTEPWNLAVPTVSTKRSNDPVKRELANLLVGFAPPAPHLDGGLNLTDYTNSRGQSAYDRYQELTSEVDVGGKNLRSRLAQIIGSEAYQRMPANSVDGVQTSRVGMLRSEISRYRRSALTRLGQEFPDIQQRKNDVMYIKNQMKRGM